MDKASYEEEEKTPFQKVRDFFKLFGLPHRHESILNCSSPHLLDDETWMFRQQHMLEEITEMTQAHRDRDLPKFADALGDLMYLVCGTAHFANLDLDAVFEEIHRANMRKVRDVDGTGKRKSKIDVVKPPGWQPPNVEQVLADQGWTND